VRLEECEIPGRDIGGGRQLASIHSADLFGPDADIATIRLVATVLRILDRQARAAQPDHPPVTQQAAETAIGPAALPLPGQHPAIGPGGPPAIPDRELGPWRFPDGNAITIVCSEIPQKLLDRTPYSNADDPDYVRLLRYSDLDSLLELHSHIRTLNPASRVRYCTPGGLSSQDYQSHLVALGGIDWNALTRMTLDTDSMPIRQVNDWSAEAGQYFETGDDGTTVRHRPVLSDIQSHMTLHEDVALFARSGSRFSRDRTITVCCGMYAPGTFGVVLALTDESVRTRNIGFLHSRFGDSQAYFVLTRIPVIHGQAVPPDWTLEKNILSTWPKSSR
jgi:hypothetical protein